MVYKFYISYFNIFCFFWFPTLELSVPYILCWKQHRKQAEEQNKTKTKLKQYIETILEAASQDPGLVCLSRKLSVSKCVRQKEILNTGMFLF